MTQKQMNEFRLSLVGELTESVTSKVTDAVATRVSSAVVGELKEIITDITQDLRGDISKLQIQFEDESIKNRELFGEVISRLDRIEEPLLPMSRRLEALEKDMILLKMAVFGKESIMGQVM